MLSDGSSLEGKRQQINEVLVRYSLFIPLVATGVCILLATVVSLIRYSS